MSAIVVGVPAEIKDNENRVSVQPDGVAELVYHGHRVLVQSGAGLGSRFSDEEYAAAGGTVVATADEVFAGADLIVKVKEPIAEEYHRFREGQQLFTYLHLAADKPLTEFLLARKVDSIAYETVQTPDRKLPLLTPMSEVAGRMSVQAAARALESPAGGAGILLGGVPGTPAAKVTIIGGGVSGTEAAKIALGMRAIVRVLDTNPSRLAYLSDVFGGRLDLVIPNRALTAAYVAESDVVIGAVLVPGAKAPKLVSRQMIASMRPGSVAVDIAIDQGGCFETSRPTTHSDPTYVEEGVVHYCVANIPGAVARTSTIALTAATLPYLVRVADRGIRGAAAVDPALAFGLSTLGGELVNQAVAEAHGLAYRDPAELLLPCLVTEPGRPELPVLDAAEQRVLGALLEKQRTVPDTYPLSLNALRSACNQATSRDPVVDYDDQTLIETLGRLRERELIRFVKPTGLRVVKYHQRLEERLDLDAAQSALIAALLLRGPQTAGELRPRTERLHAFVDREAVEDALHEMAAADVPLVAALERQAGQHDRRWIHLLGGEPAEAQDNGPQVDREQVLAAGPGARDRFVAAEYDRLAEAYAAGVEGELERLPFDRWLLDRLADDGAGGQGLDIGCGPGQVAAHLAGHGIAMTGLDNSASMVDWAQTMHPELRVVRGSFVVPPMPRGSDPRDPGWAFVTAWFAFVQLAQSELAPTLSALTRVLRRDGWLAVATYVGHEVHRPGELWGQPTELDFVLHSADALLAAAEGAGLVDVEWYLRGPLPQELPHELPHQRFYLLGRRGG